MTIAALEQAITFLSRTDLIDTARQQPLPEGVTDLLKISSGDHELLLLAQERTRQSQEDVRHAAEFYVQQILFAPQSDHYRILGVDPDDAEAKIKLHYRLLVRWLHPDKNSSDWEVVFSERVNRAWQALRTPERRREYDSELANKHSDDQLPVASRQVKPAQWRESDTDARFLSAKTIQRLPLVVFTLLGVGALLMLVLLSQLQPNVQPTVGVPDATEPSGRTTAENAQSFTAPSADTGKTSENIAIRENANAGIASAADVTTDQKPATPPVQIALRPPFEKNTSVGITAGVGSIETAGKGDRKSSKAPAAPLGLVAKDEKQKNGTERKSRVSPGPPVAKTVVIDDAATEPVMLAAAPGLPEKRDIPSDALVQQFLQRFSSVYADGDYFALHNLFTKDLSILGAAPQRTVLRSYRELFDSSESRKIALDHVTWLASDEHIVVIASYKADVMPRGRTETLSSRGDIRLDLRVENGQLRIIRLQSDTKNG